MQKEVEAVRGVPSLLKNPGRSERDKALSELGSHRRPFSEGYPDRRVGYCDLEHEVK
jgi:hypothetical protein